MTGQTVVGIIRATRHSLGNDSDRCKGKDDHTAVVTEQTRKVDDKNEPNLGDGKLLKKSYLFLR